MILDKVSCNNCNAVSIVGFDVDECPDCKAIGCLSDIKQGIDEV